MTPALVELDPQILWKHFDVLAATPRASTKEAAVRNYVLAQAARLGLETTARRRRKPRGPKTGAPRT